MPLNPERLRLLRQFHELTQTQLAKKVSVSQPTIADYEAGRKEPQPDIADALAVSLRVAPRFLFESDADHFVEPEINFRRRIAASERLKKKVIAQASLLGIIVRELRNDVPGMPKLNMPSFPANSEAEIERSAEQARVYWGLGVDGPIHSMVAVLEANGVVPTLADDATAEKVDAFSRYGPTSIVVLNSAKGSTSRTFFDAAHETAHGVLHFGQPIKPLDVRETEAHRFAGCFLMPRRSFTREFWSTGSFSIEKLLELKAKWGTSLAAILVRAYQLGLIDAATYRSAYKQLAWRGWRTGEPGEPPPEYPTLLTLAFRQFETNTKKTIDAFIESVGMSTALFNALCGFEVEVLRRTKIVSLSERREQARAVSAQTERSN